MEQGCPVYVLIRPPQAEGLGEGVAGGRGHRVDPTGRHASQRPGAQKPLLGERGGGKPQGGVALAVRTGRFLPNSPLEPLQQLLTQGQTPGAWVEGLCAWGET